MKMKMKMTLAAGALALAFAGQASAAIVTGNSYANNLVLTVWDQTSLTSFTANLGATMQSFLTGAGVTFGGTKTAPAITGTAPTAAANFSFTDAALTSYLATASANTTWAVTAVNLGILGYGTSGLMTTTTAAAMPITIATNSISAIQNANNVYLATVNPSMGAATTFSTTAATGGMAYAGATSNGMGSNFGGVLPVTNTAAIGASQNFFFLTPTANTRGSYVGAAAYQFANATGGAATWTLAANGTLSYAAAVAPVPEPGEWLLMLSGLALIGFIATRRKDEGSVTFA